MTLADMRFLIGTLILIRDHAKEKNEEGTAKELNTLIESLQEKSKEAK